MDPKETEHDYDKLGKEGFTCQCPLAGYCSLLQKEMTPTLHHKCQTSEAHRTHFLRMAGRRGVHASVVQGELHTPNNEQEKFITDVEDSIQQLKKMGLSLEDDIPSGLGDTIESVLNMFGISQDKIMRVLGMSGCGCDKRKKWFNKIFSYKQKESENV